LDFLTITPDLQQPTGRVEFQLLQKSLALKSDLQATFLEQMKSMGCKFQMDLRALSTFYGKDVQAQAKTMLQARMINYITTNFEEEDYTARLERALKHPLLIEYMQDADLCSHYYKQTVLVYTGEGAIKKPSLLSFL
jgi:tyrosine-protein phosphatase YwqE